jgi:hypothetical protein
MITRTVPFEVATIRRVASMPSSPGMRMSIITRSGRRRRARSTAWWLSSASPTTSMLGVPSNSCEARAHKRLVVADQHAQRHEWSS